MTDEPSPAIAGESVPGVDGAWPATVDSEAWVRMADRRTGRQVWYRSVDAGDRTVGVLVDVGPDGRATVAIEDPSGAARAAVRAHDALSGSSLAGGDVVQFHVAAHWSSILACLSVVETFRDRTPTTDEY